MVVLEVHNECLKNKYMSTLCSKATVFILVMYFITITFPFIIAYRSKGFWIKHEEFYEQPNVRFKGEYVFTALTNNLSHPIFCSNIPYYNKVGSLDTCSTIKVRELDYSRDGKIDEFQFHLSIDLPHNIKICSITLLLMLDYRLNTVCPLQMQSGIILQQTLNTVYTGMSTVAELRISQTIPLICSTNRIDRTHNYNLIHNQQNYVANEMEKIVTLYSERNISTHLSNAYTIFNSGGESDFSLKLHVRYPEHRIYYTPGFWHIMKWAWIQYFAVYIIFSWFIAKIKNYVIDNQLVLYYKMSPLKKNR